MERLTLYADILLPLPLKGTFTYRVPFILNEHIKQGQRAVVQFGARKVYAGLIKKIHQTPPPGIHAKYILSLLDQEPVVTPNQFKFWEWLSSYYMCSEGEVMNAALPPAMKLTGETKIVLNPDFDIDDHQELNEKEYGVLKALKNNKSLSMAQVSSISGMPKVLPLVKTMIEKGIILLHEDLENPWRPKMVSFLKLNHEYEDEESLRILYDKLEKSAPRQLEILINYIRISGRYESNHREAEQKQVVKPVKGGSAALMAMIKKDIFEVYRKKVSRLDHVKQVDEQVVLNEHQQTAFEQIKEGLKQKDIALLHGVTSSGKTEIYIKLIRECINQGKQVLYLLPEIALTAQIIVRLQKQFGSRAGIYHSRFNPMERSEVWNNLLKSSKGDTAEEPPYDLILGPRSALFLPFTNLGLVIIDEEHETSFKQHDPAPRYNGRDAAIFLATSCGAKVLLGSATPSVESFFNAQTGKYALVNLDKRHGGVLLPEIFVADLKQETRRKKMKSHFSPLLFESIKDALENKQQVILFQNRRGFSLHLECDLCNWIPQCKQCDVSLVYHKKINRLKCHYCGYSIPPPTQCPSCSATSLRMKGFGTEKIEEELPLFFPEARIARMDLDTTREKNAYSRIINEFENQEIDILTGTQMISKGLDFSNVAVVGIMNADNMLNFPDFRAHERAFQLMAQVSGRAGRHTKRGKVIIQSFNPYHIIIRQVIDNDYHAMFREQSLERRNFHYPPFNRLLRLTVLHKDDQLLNKAADALCVLLKKKFPGRVFGPEYPVITRIRNVYQKNILIKLDKGKKLPEDKDHITQIIQRFNQHKDHKQARVVINVDPL